MRSEGIYGEFGIDERILRLSEKAEESLKDIYSHIDEVCEYNQLKVLKAMQDEEVSEACLLETTGYGYNDLGRDALERVYARIFHTEAALVRTQIISGTHALYLAIAGNTKPGDIVYSPCGLPYDTLQTVLGLNGTKNSLKDYGVGFSYTPLNENGKPDYERIEKEIPENVRLCEIQRSRGYDGRESFTMGELKELIAFIKKLRPETVIMVDNCYGEFIDYEEPTDIGADMAVGSLIKNPGGGLAPCGGYIAGTQELVDGACARLTAPGLLGEIGPSLGNNRAFFQGLFMAPHVSAQALKGAVLLSKMCELCGFSASPSSVSERTDIIQCVDLCDRERLVAFCEGIQMASPVDSMYMPEPGDMPGYDCDIIMAAGCFTQGSSIELSADAPLREPYRVFFQGGLTYSHAKLGVMKALSELIERGLVQIK